jgi:hypothetical protein
MDDNDLQLAQELKNAIEAAPPNQIQHNFYVGAVRTFNLYQMDPGLLSHNCNFPKSCFSDPSGLWAKFFDPTGRKGPICAVPGD